MIVINETADKSLSAIRDAYIAAAGCDERWSETDAVDMNEVEFLVRQLRAIPKQTLKNLYKTTAVIKYTKKNPIWEESEIRRWPDLVMDETSDLLDNAGLILWD